MKREQLLAELRRWCRKNGVQFEIDAVSGKGSHMRVFVGTDKSTTIKSGELRRGYVDIVLKQLGIAKRDIKR
jgi:hypothetical protein